jgi:threonine aldolase
MIDRFPAETYARILGLIDGIPKRRSRLMGTLQRRRFLQMGACMAAMSMSGGARWAGAEKPTPGDQIVRFYGDGLSPTPRETSNLLQRLTSADNFDADSYSLGGVVEELENRVARQLGKERAVFMPTGTLANHLAVRALCEGRGRRVLAQADSHLVNDTGDCVQALSSLNLIPLAPGRSCFTADDVERVLAQTSQGKVATRVGALSVESPVRRLDNVAVPLDELKQALAPARKADVGLHLDGARLPLYTAHLGIDPADVAALFDTVYVSMYKCFNAPSGAVLAGPASLIDNLYHARRMFGGGMPQVWPFAAVALHYLEGFAEQSPRVLRLAEDLFARLAADGRCSIERIPNGTNLFRLILNEGDPEAWRQLLAARGVELMKPKPDSNVFVCKMNPTWLRSSADELARLLLEQ